MDHVFRVIALDAPSIKTDSFINIRHGRSRSFAYIRRSKPANQQTNGHDVTDRDDGPCALIGLNAAVHLHTRGSPSDRPTNTKQRNNETTKQRNKRPMGHALCGISRETTAPSTLTLAQMTRLTHGISEEKL